MGIKYQNFRSEDETVAKDTARKERRDEVGFEASRWPRRIPALRIGFGVGGVSLPSLNKKCVVCPELEGESEPPPSPGGPHGSGQGSVLLRPEPQGCPRPERPDGQKLPWPSRPRPLQDAEGPLPAGLAA